MRFRPAAFFLPLCLFASAAPPPSSSKPPVIAIAGLLGGKTLVPLAQYVHGRWVRTWPLPDEQVERIVPNLRQVPKGWFPVDGGVPSEWYLWTQDLNGAPIRVSRPVLAEAHCGVVWGLSTRLLPTDHETTALATNVLQGIQTFHQFAVGASTDDLLTKFLKSEFEKAEIREIRSKRPDAATLLARRPVRDPTIEVSCATVRNESDELCSLEASRGLGSRPYKELPDCEEITFVRGWFLTSPDTQKLLTSEATLTDCNWKEVRTAAPMLLITDGARNFVVVREHGYEDESFVVYELHSDRLERVLEVAGGGC